MSQRSFRWLVLLAIVVAVAACDQTDDGSEASPTSAPSSTGGEAAAESKLSTSSTVPVDFDAEVEQVTEDIAAADGDLCALVAAASQSLSAVPRTPEEVKKAIEISVMMMEEMADLSEGEDAEIFEDRAEALEAEAEAEAYSPTWFAGGSGVKSMNDKKFGEASSHMSERYRAECTTSTTGP